MNNQFITVIITAYNRRKFLESAIKSAINQTLPRKYYEIIVVKNFFDERIDDIISKNSIKSIFCDSPNQGEHLAAALKEANGNILSFLDDDDMFTKDKLEIVHSTFQHEDIVFHRNRRIFLNERGMTVGEDRPHPSFEAKGSDLIFLRKLINLGMGVNSSTMSIRRSVLDAISIERFRRIRLAVDSLYFVASLLQGGILVYDPRPLTLYRVHGNQSFINTSSIDAYVRRRCDLAKKFVSDYGELMKVVESTPYEVVVKPLLVRSKVVSAVFCPSESKPTMPELAYLLRRQNMYLDHPQDFFLLLGLMATCIFSPLRDLSIRVEYKLAKAVR